MSPLATLKGPLSLAPTAPAAIRPRARVINPVLLLVSCLWGVGNLLTKWVLDVLEPAALLALRMGTVGILFVALLLIVPPRRMALRDWLMVAVFGGGLVAVQLLSFSYAMKMTTASEGSLLISTAPAWTAAMVALLGMERVTKLNWLGIAVASGGVVMIVLGPAGRIQANAPARLSGDLIMLASAWLYGGYMVLSRRWMQRLGDLPVICCTFAASGLLLAAFGARQLAATDWSKLTAGHWAAIAQITFLAAFVGIILWYRTIARTSASGTAVYQYLVPVVSVVGATAFLGERIGALQLVGIAVTLMGVYLARVPAVAGARAPA